MLLLLTLLVVRLPWQSLLLLPQAALLLDSSVAAGGGGGGARYSGASRGCWCCQHPSAAAGAATCPLVVAVPTHNVALTTMRVGRSWLWDLQSVPWYTCTSGTFW